MQPFAPQVVFRGRRFYVQLLAFVDQRINHVNLASRFQLRPQESQHFAKLGFIAHRGDYFSAITRHLIDYRNIEIAVHRHC